LRETSHHQQTREEMSKMNNTHYNLIDTFRFSFGEEKWKRICAVLWIRLDDLIPTQNTNKYSESNLVPSDIIYFANQIKDAPLFLDFRFQHICTLVELFVWAKIEGKYYEFGKKKDFVINM
jgi:hypothetical protein